MVFKQNFVAVIKCGGKIIRETSSGDVYLPFNTEYSIFLKNKDTRKALVGIEVDGQDVLNNNRLILSGNETQEIKGFMRDMCETNRFRFINKTKEIQRYRGDRIDDGLIRVTYQFEAPYCFYTLPITVNNDWGSVGPCWSYTSSETNIYSFCDSGGAVGSKVSYCSSPLSDEGITVKGSKIKQNYTYGYVGQLESTVYTIVLRLRGMHKNNKIVKKAITIKTKLMCPTCGRKNRSFNTYCYNCGTHLH